MMEAAERARYEKVENVLKKEWVAQRRVTRQDVAFFLTCVPASALWMLRQPTLPRVLMSSDLGPTRWRPQLDSHGRAGVLEHRTVDSCSAQGAALPRNPKGMGGTARMGIWRGGRKEEEQEPHK